MKNIDFYKGIMKDQSNRSIDDIWLFTKIEQESVHDYIQWIFPLNERSRFNTHAPILTVEEIVEFNNNELLKSRLIKSFEFMLNFYGFVYDENTSSISKSSEYDIRISNWLTPFNHNYLRITRILKSLVLLGQLEIAQKFFVQLEYLYNEHPHLIGRSIDYWKEAIK